MAKAAQLYRTSAEGRQLDQIVFWHRFQMAPGFTPGAQASGNDERVESSISQHVRHPGAGRFPRSSAVEINLFVLGQALDLLIEIVRLDANRSLNAFGADVVVTVAAHINDLDAV